MSGQTATMAINPVLFQEDNRLLFRLHRPLHARLRRSVAFEPCGWCWSNTSALTLHWEKLALPNDPRAVAKPFYDQKDIAGAQTAVRFLGANHAGDIQAAGIVASWFGALAAYKGQFPGLD